MLYEKGLIYKYYLNNPTQAEESFTELIAEHSQNLLVEFAAKEMGVKLEKSEKNNIVVNKQENGYSLDNYPNPFNPTTKITYSLPKSGFVTLKVYNTLGQEVATLVNEVKAAGTYEVDFDASRLASGMYLYTLTSGKITISKKMLVVK